jgi:hypothetical protein
MPPPLPADSASPPIQATSRTSAPSGASHDIMPPLSTYPSDPNHPHTTFRFPDSSTAAGPSSSSPAAHLMLNGHGSNGGATANSMKRPSTYTSGANSSGYSLSSGTAGGGNARKRVKRDTDATVPDNPIPTSSVPIPMENTGDDDDDELPGLPQRQQQQPQQQPQHQSASSSSSTNNANAQPQKAKATRGSR